MNYRNLIWVCFSDSLLLYIKIYHLPLTPTSSFLSFLSKITLFLMNCLTEEPSGLEPVSLSHSFHRDHLLGVTEKLHRLLSILRSVGICGSAWPRPASYSDVRSYHTRFWDPDLFHVTVRWSWTITCPDLYLIPSDPPAALSPPSLRVQQRPASWLFPPQCLYCWLTGCVRTTTEYSFRRIVCLDGV